MFSASMDIEIAFGDCDPAGIVYYPNYFRFFDTATARLLSLAFGCTKREWIKRFAIVGIPMVDTGAKFHRPARFGDKVRIDSTITEIRRSSFLVSHRLFNGDELAVSAEEIRVWALRDPDDPEAIRGVQIPTEVRELLES